MGIQESSAGCNATGTRADVTTNWTHVALKLESGTATLYIDGSETITKNFTSIDATGDFLIGAIKTYTGIGNHFDGNIDEVAIFDKGLSEAEINALYNSGSPDQGGYCDDAALALYDSAEGSSQDCNVTVEVWANYTNASSGAMITGANCTLVFEVGNSTVYSMPWDGDNYYNNSHYIPYSGTYDYNVTCSASGFDTITETGNITMSGLNCTLNPAEEVVPEGSGMQMVAVIAILAIVTAIIVMKKK